MKIGFIALGVLIIGTVAAFAMSDMFISGTWRYKMTVIVETPEGIKTGSAVREISNRVTPLDDFPQESGNPASIKGEAVVVDLGDRGVLFALISDKSDSEFYQAFPAPNNGPTTAKGIKYYRSLEPGLKAPLDPTKYPGYPKLVTFEDINDPKSVQGLTKDNIAEFFGDGVSIQEITLEITDEPVTNKVLNFLPYLNSHKPFAIGPYQFKQGD